MLVPWKALSGTHRRTSKCTWGEEKKRQRLAAVKERDVAARYFSAYEHPLETDTSFKYLGRVISATDNDWPVVVRKLARVKKVWSRILRILRMEGAMPHMSGFFFKDIIHAVLLFRAENWVATPRMGKALGRFQT